MTDRKSHMDTTIRIGVCIPKSPSVFWKPVYQGIRDRIDAYETEGVPIELIMRYEPLLPDQGGNESFSEWVKEKHLQGLILFPKGRSTFLRDIASRVNTTVMGVRNVDLLDLCGYIGTDPDEEGRLAAQLLFQKMPNTHNIAIIRPNYRYYDYTTVGRRWGFCNYLNHDLLDQTISVQDIFVDFHSKLSASMIARELAIRFTGGSLDCVYATAGNIGEVCQGLFKARRAQYPDGQNPFSHTCCIGHEYPKSAQRYIEAGLLGGCLSQDSYQYGYQALEQTVERCLGRRKKRTWDFIPPKVEWFL